MERKKDNKKRRRRNKSVKVKRILFPHNFSLKWKAKEVKDWLFNLKPRVQSRVN
jgi:hypothetical protein